MNWSYTQEVLWLLASWVSDPRFAVLSAYVNISVRMYDVAALAAVAIETVVVCAVASAVVAVAAASASAIAAVGVVAYAALASAVGPIDV